MKFKAAGRIVGPSLFALAVISGCNIDVDDTSERADEIGQKKQFIGDDSREEAINDLIYSTLDIVADPESQEILGTWDEFESKGTGTFKCTYREVNETANTEEIIAYNPNSGVLYPGAIIQGDTLQGGVLEPVQLSRTGGEIFVDGVTVVGTAPTRTIDKYSAGSVATAIKDIFEDASDTHTAAGLEYERKDVRQLEETMLSLGIDAEWAKAELNLDVQHSQAHERTDMFVFFRQRFFTASVQNWAGPNKAKLFESNVLPEEVSLTMSPRNPPVYVRNVTYGRMMIMRLTTDRSESELTAALDAAFSAGGGTFGVDLDATHQQTFQETTFKVAAIGGDASLATQLSTTGPTGLADYLNDGANVSLSNPGEPLAYVASHLATDDVIKMAYSTRYQVPDCHLAADKLEVKLERIRIHKDGDRIGKGDFKYKFGASVQEYDQNGGVKPVPIYESGTIKKGNGEAIDVNRTSTFWIDTANSSCFNVLLELREYDGDNEDEKIGDTRQYCYSPGRGIWENTSHTKLNRHGHNPDLRMWRQESGRVDAEFEWRITRKHECGSNLLSDGILCVPPSQYGINRSGASVVEVCGDEPVLVDARNLYATSSHVESDKDRFFISAFESDPWWNSNGPAHSEWVFMGREPNYIVAERFDARDFYAEGGMSMQKGKYYRIKLASFPWHETSKLVHIRPYEAVFSLNESGTSINVDHDDDIVLSASDSCTQSEHYELTLDGAGLTLTDELSASEVANIHALDVRTWAAEQGMTIEPGYTYDVTLEVSDGSSQSGSITVDPCPTYTKWNGGDCVTPLDSDIWAVGGDDCIVPGPAGAVDIATCVDADPAQFEMLPVGENMVRLQDIGGTECLSASDIPNAPAMLRPCGFDSTVRWEVVNLGIGIAQLRHEESGQCLSFATNGVPLMTTCVNTGPTQIQFDWWKGLQDSSPAAPQAAVQFESANQASCIEMPGQSGDIVTAGDCSAPEQSITLERVDETTVRLKQPRTNQCAVAQGSNGSLLLHEDCTGASDENFELWEKNGALRLRHKETNTCLFNTTDGKVATWGCWEDPNMVYKPSAVGVNLAIGATVTADSSFSGYSPAKIVDGNRNTTVGGAYSWANGHTYRPNGRIPQNVDIDFGVTTKMSRVEIYTSKNYEISDYDLQYFDGETWTTILTVTGNTEVHRTHMFPPVAGSKLRIIGRRGPAIQPQYVRLNEVEVY